MYILLKNAKSANLTLQAVTLLTLSALGNFRLEAKPAEVVRRGNLGG